ncbi:T9SS type A sorting domain-containing protein [Chitinophagales bacterium]|nr:T9SS type A sorting domain-containing protein [Chitinophagales bacterium]
MKKIYTSRLLALLLLLCSIPAIAQETRSYTGNGNNETHPTWGEAETVFRYIMAPIYADGISEPNGQDRPNPRAISNLLYGQDEFIPSTRGISDYGWQFGQLMDHEITFNDENRDGTEFMPIPVPECDPLFDPNCSGQVIIPSNRTLADPTSGTSIDNPRKTLNSLTPFMDASVIYGIEEERIDWIRTHEGGKLKTSAGNLLPFNTTDGEYNSPVDANAPEMAIEGPPPARHFISGDLRANEQPGLTSMHTLFMREHNRMCDEYAVSNPAWDDEKRFQEARRYVGALIQSVAYNEWLPALGIDIAPYEGYDEEVQPTILNAFSAAAFRMGHTLVNNQLIRLDDSGEELNFGSIHIKDAFFNLDPIRLEGGIDPVLKGLASQTQQQFDTKVVNALRNFLFGPPGAGGLDLVSLNIMRARERGLPDYNTLRVAFGLPAHIEFDDITVNLDRATILEAMYSDINNIDPWVGMLTEDPLPDCAVGALIHNILKMQFENIRNGDRFWFEVDPAFSSEEIEIINNTKLSDIIKRNTSVTSIQDNVFFSQEVVSAVEMSPFEKIREIEISAYPNPAINTVQMNIRSLDYETGYFSLTDLSGKELFSEELEISPGNNNYTFELSEAIASGVYIIQFTSESGKGQLRLVKQ